MTSYSSRPPLKRRRRPWLIALPLAIVVLLAALWTGFWFYAANRADLEITQWRTREAQNGPTSSPAAARTSGAIRSASRCTVPIPTRSCEVGSRPWDWPPRTVSSRSRSTIPPSSSGNLPAPSRSPNRGAPPAWLQIGPSHRPVCAAGRRRPNGSRSCWTTASSPRVTAARSRISRTRSISSCTAG